MAIIEISEDEWLGMNRIGTGVDAILFSTPFCGTCKVAERMLEIADAAGTPATLYKINMNYAPKLREAWRISSVPCLAVVKNGEPVQLEYAMRSVDHIYNLLNHAEQV
ncbi:thioredoxin family protein [Paenibacillus sp. NEAU-GSW1]|uniref:thioredoxin family protein n=1 Tax=Paenibacillus sp. NEAU-GSW1 TaxID=2682486 RepID=UPI0012E0C982|nr:thioredoxin family protein [Paenibacillus sp. NEAU-GSW1]MUT64811.1 thioredoxin [Paenibacillus sp. NEAU-GSW1]